MPIYTLQIAFVQHAMQKGVGSVEKKPTGIINMGRVCINTAHVCINTAHVYS